MAVKETSFQRRPISDDPAVNAAMGESQEDTQSDPIYGKQAQRAARLRNMTPGQRRKFERDMARSKLTLDLPADLIQQLNTVCNIKDDNFPISQLVALLIRHGLAAIENGEIDLDSYKIGSRVPRFRWFLVENAEDDIEG